jgi:hypothetical protein
MNTKNCQTLLVLVILVIVICCVYNIERFTNKKISFQHIYSRAYGSHMGMDQILNQYRKIEDYHKYPFNLKQYYYAI